MKRRGWLMLAMALTASQTGHLVAYQMRFGASALEVQSTGAHWYFLSSARTVLGLVALAMLVALSVVGFGRLAAGRRLEPDSSTPFMRTLATVYTLQLGVFAIQETVEAFLGQGHLVSVPSLLLWGAVGQLPVALAAALAWRWLGARVRPAIVAIRCRVTVRPFVPAVSPILLPAAAGVFTRDRVSFDFTRRGPPSF